MEGLDMQEDTRAGMVPNSQEAVLRCKLQGRKLEEFKDSHQCTEHHKPSKPPLDMPGQLQVQGASGKPQLGSKAMEARWLEGAPSDHRRMEAARHQQHRGRLLMHGQLQLLPEGAMGVGATRVRATTDVQQSSANDSNLSRVYPLSG